MEVIELEYRAVIDYLDRRKPTRDICSPLGISERTLRRWAKRYREAMRFTRR